MNSNTNETACSSGDGCCDLDLGHTDLVHIRNPCLDMVDICANDKKMGKGSESYAQECKIHFYFGQ